MRLAALVVWTLLVLAPSSASADAPSVAVQAAPRAPVVAALLEEELRASTEVRVAPLGVARFVVRATRARITRDDGELSCVVALVVEDARGVVRAMLTGRARTAATASAELELTALRHAIRSALRPLAMALLRR